MPRNVGDVTDRLRHSKRKLFFYHGREKKKNQKVLTDGEAEAGAEWEGGDWAAGAWLPGLVALPDWPGLW